MGTAVLVGKPYRCVMQWAILLTLTSTPAWAHSWYDPYCCNSQDCTEYKGTVVEGPTGYKLGDGKIILYKDAKVSMDANYHICIYHGQLRCFYAPPRTF